MHLPNSRGYGGNWAGMEKESGPPPPPHPFYFCCCWPRMQNGESLTTIINHNFLNTPLMSGSSKTFNTPGRDDYCDNPLMNRTGASSRSRGTLYYPAQQVTRSCHRSSGASPKRIAVSHLQSGKSSALRPARKSRLPHCTYLLRGYDCLFPQQF